MRALLLATLILLPAARPGGSSPAPCGADEEGSCGAQAKKEALSEEDIAALRSGRCGGGSVEQPGRPIVVDARFLKKLNFLDARCPLVVSGLERMRERRALSRWGDLDQLERVMTGAFWDTRTFDASPSGEFHYWDDSVPLASRLKEVGVAKRGHRKVTTGRQADFCAALREGLNSSLGAVRYGNEAVGLMGKHTERLRRLFGAKETPNLWISVAGSYSTPHYDPYLSFFMMLSGKKRLLLAPPRDAHLFGSYPMVHPCARQTRWHFGRHGDAPASENVLDVTIGPGEAVFIPANWIHYVMAVSTSVTLSMTRLTHEAEEFKTTFSEPLPFAGSNTATWPPQRRAEAMQVFIPSLLEALGYDRASNASNPLLALATNNYGRETRRELGWAPLKRYPACSRPGKADRKVAKVAAKAFAKRFASFREDVLDEYVVNYLEVLLILNVEAMAKNQQESAMSTGISYVVTCLLPLWNKTSS